MTPELEVDAPAVRAWAAALSATAAAISTVPPPTPPGPPWSATVAVTAAAGWAQLRLRTLTQDITATARQAAAAADDYDDADDRVAARLRNVAGRGKA
jgi:hypothetical protein